MRNIIDNFLRLSAQNAGEAVVWTLFAIYAGLVLICVMGIFLGKRGKGFKSAWSLVVLLLPFAGMALYCIYCLCTTDYPLLGQLGINVKTKKSETKKSKRSLFT